MNGDEGSSTYDALPSNLRERGSAPHPFEHTRRPSRTAARLALPLHLTRTVLLSCIVYSPSFSRERSAFLPRDHYRIKLSTFTSSLKTPDMPSSEASDLSDLNSADFQHSERGEDTEHDDTDNTLKPPPIKKRRLNKPGPSPLGTPSTTIGPSAPIIDDGDVSSDTSGSCPPSPRAFKDPSISTDERAAANEHVHICQWAGCLSGDLEDQDALVEHINNVHIPESKDDKYACDWGDCRSKTKPQGSAYALRAHMRSHTKEKPFYCALPGMPLLAIPSAETLS